MSERCTVPRLMLVIDSQRSRWATLDLAAAATAGGIDAIYLRNADRGSPLATRSPSPCGQGEGLGARVLSAALRERIDPAVTIVINVPGEGDWPDGVGLHLRERDPFPDWTNDKSVRPALVGRSVHSPDSAAVSTGVDYLLAGHVYPSASKPGKPPLGLEGLASIVAVTPFPVIAIGGITAERVAEVMRVGAYGVAVVGAIAQAADPYRAARSLRTAVERVHHIESEAVAMQQTDTTSTSGTTFEIVVNGKAVTVPERSTIHDFLASKRMTDAMAIVERNSEIVPRGEYATTRVTPGDNIEVIHAVGGG